MSVSGKSMVGLLMLGGVTMTGGENRKKEECHTFHYLIQIVSLGDKNRTHKGGLNSATYIDRTAGQCVSLHLKKSMRHYRHALQAAHQI